MYNVGVNLPKLSLHKAWDTKLRHGIYELLEENIGVFQSVAEGKVPVWTGQAAGTLYADVFVRGNYTDPFGTGFDGQYARPNKNASTGKDSAAYEIVGRGKNYSWEWGTDIVYFPLNDNFSTKIASSPWGAVKAGARAAEAAWTSQSTDLKIRDLVPDINISF